jgi:hypothetical protein
MTVPGALSWTSGPQVTGADARLTGRYETAFCGT